MLNTHSTNGVPARRAVSSSPMRHVESAIAGQADDTAARRRELRAHRAGEAVADRGEAAVGDEVTACLLGVEAQPAPVAGEAAVRHQDRVIRHDGIEFAHQAADIDRRVLRLQPIGRALGPLRHHGGHLGAIRHALRLCLAAVGERGRQILQRKPRVARQAQRRCAWCGRFPRPGCRCGSAACRAGSTGTAASGFRRACSRPRSARRMSRPDRSRCANSGRISPAESGCVQAIAPLPDIVCATGMPKPSASASSAS